MNVFQAFNFLSANNRKPFNHWCKSDDICLSFSRSAFSIKLITSWRQRIYKDKDEGVSIQDCEKISKHISKVLDTKFSANENYFLEVSSPGLERKFFKYEQYLSFIGSTLKIRYLENNSKFKTDKGKLKRVSEEYLYLENDEQEFEISFDSIQRANLEFIGEQNAK